MLRVALALLGRLLIAVGKLTSRPPSSVASNDGADPVDFGGERDGAAGTYSPDGWRFGDRLRPEELFGWDQLGNPVPTDPTYRRSLKPEGDDVRGASGQLLGWTVPHELTRIHAAPCAFCPSAHHPPDPEALDYRAAPRRVQLASLFPCAWRPEALCKGYCDFLGVTPEDVSAGQVEAARRELEAHEEPNEPDHCFDCGRLELLNDGGECARCAALHTCAPFSGFDPSCSQCRISAHNGGRL